MLPWQVDKLEDVLISSARPVNDTHSSPSPLKVAVSLEHPSSEVCTEKQCVQRM